MERANEHNKKQMNEIELILINKTGEKQRKKN